MNDVPNHPPREEDYTKPGPFSIPGRNWLLLGFLWVLLVVKYSIIFGLELPIYSYLAGSIVYFLVPWLTARLAWKGTGERPYWADNAFIGAGALLFILFSIPAYSVGLV